MSRVNDTGSSDQEAIPSIEIGSFIALRPDESEFIGSASGIFFTNTVFQAFAATAPPHTASSINAADTPGQDSSHGLFVAAEDEPGQDVDDPSHQERQVHDGAGHDDPQATVSSSWGIAEDGLGIPPSRDKAKALVMLYFRDWHPFFPFLHGPTFLDQVDAFYESGSEEYTDKSKFDHRKKVCRAVTLQSVFNIAALGWTGRQRLSTSCQISSTSSLTNLIGVLSSCNDIASLQALLAAGLYLMTRMSLRTASTIIGVVTQAVYRSGLHRCPYRYVQLPPDVRLIRQRIFWCAYILDRQLSQALGHPPAMKDDEIDVCYPGMTELHSPVRARQAFGSTACVGWRQVPASEKQRT